MLSEKEESEIISRLTEQGFTYSQIGKELREIRRRKNIGEKIYKLREQGLSYEKIKEELKKEGIILGEWLINKICKEMYETKEEKDPRQISEEDKEERKRIIFDLREERLTYSQIEKELKKDNKTMSRSTINKRCKEMYGEKGKEEPKIRKEQITQQSRELDKKIYELKKQGLTHNEISNQLKKEGINISKIRVWQRYTRIVGYTEKQLAQEILKLMVTRNATIEQVEQIAKYYEVDLEKTMNSLDER